MNNIGRIISVNKTNWTVLYNNKIYQGIINNSYINEFLPAVGDYVEILIDNYNNCIIKNICNRKNCITKASVDRTNENYRKGKKQVLAANIDVVFIVTSLNNDFNIGKLERLALVGIESKSKVAFLLTKADLCIESEREIYKFLINERFPNYPVFTISTFDEFGIEKLKDIWKENETAVFIGSSGVGKSTLINYLLGDDVIKTNEIRLSDDKGKHTTTSRNLYILNDGRVVIDEPGIRSVALSEENNCLDKIFDKIKQFESQCKFTTCTHENRYGCAVLKAIDDGIITIDELNRYKKIKSKQSGKNKEKIMKNKKNYYKINNKYK